MQLRIFLIPIIFFSFLGAILGVSAFVQSLPADLFDDPRFLILNEQTNQLYILNNKDQELVVLDIKSRSLIKKVKLEAGNSIIMAYDAQNGKIYISHSGSNKISIIKENETGKENYRPGLIQEIKNPTALAIDNSRNRVYVSSASNDGSVSIIDSLSDSVKDVWPLGFQPRHLILNSKGSKLYVIGESKETFGVIETGTGKFQKISIEGQKFLTAEFNKTDNLLYLLDSASKELIVLDDFSDKIIRLKVGSDPRHITISKELERVYISNFLSQDITVVDIKTSRVVDTISLGTGAYPGKVLVNYLSGKLYIPTMDLNKIIVVDAATNKIIKEVESGGRNPDYGLVDLKANEIYFLNPESNNLVIIDGISDSQAALLPPEANTGGPIFARPENVKFDYQKNLIYVLNNLNGTMTVIDAKTDEPIKIIPVGRNPRGIGFADKKLYITSADDDSVTILNRQDLSILKTLKLGGKPGSIAVNKKNNKVYIINHNSGILSVIDGKTDSLIKEIQLNSEVTPRLQYSDATGRIYISDLTNNRILVIDSEKDEVIKELAVPDISSVGLTLWTAPSDPKIYVRSANEGKILVIQESDYKTLNTISVPPYSIVSPFSYRNLLYVAKDGGLIDVINDEDGKIVKTISLGRNAEISSLLAVPLVGDEGDGRLLALDGRNGHLYICDLSNNVILSALRVGRGAMGPFMNFRTGKVYIANYRDDTVSVFDTKEGKFLALITNQTPLSAFKFGLTKIYYYLAFGLVILAAVIFFIIRRLRKKSVLINK